MQIKILGKDKEQIQSVSSFKITNGILKLLINTKDKWIDLEDRGSMRYDKLTDPDFVDKSFNPLCLTALNFHTDPDVREILPDVTVVVIPETAEENQIINGFCFAMQDKDQAMFLLVRRDLLLEKQLHELLYRAESQS